MLKTSPHKIALHLKKRGWKKHHIATVIKHLKTGEENKHHKIKDRHVLLMAFFIIIIGNVLALAGILPVLIGMPQWVILITVTALGLCFGYLMDGVIREFDIMHKHFMASGILISVIATITMLAVIELGNTLLRPVGLTIQINPLLTIFFYISGFSLPHLINRAKDKRLADA